MFGLWKWKGRRAEVEVVTDLDAILTREVAFRFQGRTYLIPPMPVSQFLQATGALAKCDLLRKKEEVSKDELLDAYHAVFQAVVKGGVKRDVLEKMSVQQIAALYNLVLEQIMGKAFLDGEKKSPVAS